MLMLVSALVFVSIALSPIYVFPSGTPQPADFVMTLAVAAAVLHALLTRSDMMIGRLPISLGLLVLWITIVSIFWAMIYSSAEFLMDPLFWSYNFFVSALVLLILERRSNGYKILSRAILASLIVSTFGVVFGLSGLTVRNSGFFNNPNQLAYFSICAMACILVLNDFRLSSLSIPLSLVLGAVGLLSAASLGAFAGSVGLLLALIAANLRRPSSIVMIPFATAAIFVSFMIIDARSDNVISRGLEARIERSGTKLDDVFAERKYDRIAIFHEHIILGAGSALHEQRFYPHGAQEIHSSFGAMVFNYGIPGLIMLLTYITSVSMNARIPVLLTISAPLIYSITHMGLRFTFFWILLSIILHKSMKARGGVSSCAP